MSENTEESEQPFPPEVVEILDLASAPDGIYSALIVPGGIRLVLSSDTKKIDREFYWSEADAFQSRIRKWLGGGPAECGECGGQGWYVDGPTDEPYQRQCENCQGKGHLE